ncbi:MAG: DUF6629 family protein [Mycobacterium sp.]
MRLTLHDTPSAQLNDGCCWKRRADDGRHRSEAGGSVSAGAGCVFLGSRGTNRTTVQIACFSLTADLSAGIALIPVAVLSLREVKYRRELLFALLPTVFSVHQLIEVAIWARQDGDISAGAAHLAVFAYLFIALPLLPTLFPLSVLLLEPKGARLRVAPFVALGAVVSMYLAVVVLTHPIGVTPHPHCLAY